MNTHLERASRWALMLVASMVCSLGIAVPALWILAPLGLTGFFYLLLLRTNSWKSAALYGLLFGFITSGAGIFWFWDTLPIDWIGVHNPYAQFYAVLATWSYINIFLAVPIAGAGALIWLLRKNIFVPFAVPFIWIVAEQGRMWGFAFATWGKESLMGPHFSAASIGYALTESPYLLQLAHPFGIVALNGITALAVMVCIDALRAVAERRIRMERLLPAFTLLGILVVPLAVPYTTSPSMSSEPIHISVIGTDVEPGRADPNSIMRTLIAISKSDVKPDIIMIPEGQALDRLFPDNSPEQVRLELLKMLGPQETIILHAGPRTATLTFESTTRGILGAYKKIFLMPMGEYPPYFAEPFFSVAHDEHLSMYAKNVGGGATKGNAVVPFLYKGVTFGPLLCSDIISPVLYNELGTKYHARVFLGLANQSWFHHSHILYGKTLQFAKVHSVQNRAYFVDSVGGAPSFFINPKGELVSETQWGTDSVLNVEIP